MAMHVFVVSWVPSVGHHQMAGTIKRFPDVRRFFSVGLLARTSLHWHRYHFLTSRRMTFVLLYGHPKYVRSLSLSNVRIIVLLVPPVARFTKLYAAN